MAFNKKLSMEYQIYQTEWLFFHR